MPGLDRAGLEQAPVPLHRPEGLEDPGRRRSRHRSARSPRRARPRSARRLPRSPPRRRSAVSARRTDGSDAAALRERGRPHGGVAAPYARHSIIVFRRAAPPAVFRVRRPAARLSTPQIEGVEGRDGDRLREGGSVADSVDVDAAETRLSRLHGRRRLPGEDVALGAANDQDGAPKLFPEPPTKPGSRRARPPATDAERDRRPGRPSAATRRPARRRTAQRIASATASGGSPESQGYCARAHPVTAATSGKRSGMPAAYAATRAAPRGSILGPMSFRARERRRSGATPASESPTRPPSEVPRTWTASSSSASSSASTSATYCGIV